MVSFDVLFLCANVPLDTTIEVILKWVYDNSNIITTICKNMNEIITITKNMKEIILLCTNLSFYGKLYVQTNGVAMGSSLGNILIKSL